MMMKVRMNRVTVRQRKIRDLGSPAETAERAGFGPKINVEGPYFTLRWKKEQIAEALDSAGMTLEQILRKHLAPRLDATKTVHIKHRGEISATFKPPEWSIRLKMFKLAPQLHGALSEQ